MEAAGSDGQRSYLHCHEEPGPQDPSHRGSGAGCRTGNIYLAAALRDQGGSMGKAGTALRPSSVLCCPQALLCGAGCENKLTCVSTCRMRACARAREYRRNLQTTGRGKRVRSFAETSAEKSVQETRSQRERIETLDFRSKMQYNWPVSVHEIKIPFCEQMGGNNDGLRLCKVFYQ